MAQYDGISFPGWEVVRKIGEGSFGGVYEIQRVLPDGKIEKAALKKLTVPRDNEEIEELYLQSLSTNSITAHYKNQMGELVSEYSLMQSLNGCPNIVNCHDIQYIQHEDNIGWDIYIRMELLKPLKKTLSSGYSEELVCSLGIQLCNALVACHEENVIHRDIKPENILVSDKGVFKLGDFGIAKVSERTTTGTMIGTYGYMAPEVANRQHYGAAADIYSLGMVLYWLMNRRTLPFLPLPPSIPNAVQRQEAQNRRFAGETLPLPADGSPKLKRIVMKACAFLPEERYRTAEEMRADLLRCTQKQEPAKVEEPAQSAQEEPSDDYRTHSVFAFQPFSLEETVIDTSVGAASAKEEPPAPADIPQNEPVLSQFSQQEKTPHAEREKPETKPEKQPEKQCTAPAKKRKGKDWVWLLLLCAPLLCIVAWGAKLTVSRYLDSQSRIVLPQSTESRQTVAATGKATNNTTDKLQAQKSSTVTNAQLSRTAFDSLLRQKSVQTVQFTDSQQGAPGNATDLSENKDGSILGWWSGDTLTVAGRGRIYAPEDCSEMFNGCSTLQKIDWGNCFDTSKATTMWSMFSDCSGLTNLDVSGFNTSKVTDMGWMFYGCSSLTNLNVSGFDTSKVQDMMLMFYGCAGLTNLNVSGFDTSEVVKMNGMFSGCYRLTKIDVSGFDTSKVNNMYCMFEGCTPSAVNWGNFDRHGWSQANFFGA